MNSIRLSEFEQTSLVDTIRKYDKNTAIYLFGSRTDINKKGGDIDVIIISDRIKKDDLAFIEWELFKQIDERKIDLLLSTKNINDSFIKLTIKSAVQFC